MAEKIARAFGCCQNSKAATRGRLVIARTLIIGKEEQLIFDDSSTSSSAKFVPAQQRTRNTLKIVRPLVGVELVVPNEFKSRAMILVSARLSNHTDDTAHKITELSGKRSA